MKLYSENDSYKIYNGDMLDMLQVIKPESIDAIVCDPPYELGFMNKSWDSTGIAFKKETWQNCFEVLKPGGYLLAFGGSRTYHRIACAIEDAGFEIRDCVMYLYGCGFSKSYNIGLAIDKKNGVSQNKWQGWGTCLKPAYEPIIVARKPFKGSVVDNIIKYKVGGLNIEECRVGETGGIKKVNIIKNSGSKICRFGCDGDKIETGEGRFPANVITDGSEEVAKGMPNTTSQYNPEGKHQNERHRENYDRFNFGYKQRIDTGFNDSGSAMRYFYSAKASKKDRDEGLDAFQDKTFHSVLNQKNGSGDRLDGAKTPIRKKHPSDLQAN